MKIDLKAPEWNDKASHNPDELRIYLEENDYLRAYSKHTDLRVRRDGPALAIGGQWEEHGPLQLAFLKAHGLTPASTLLDLGCGTGRFARHAVPFLAPSNYTGIDISLEALQYARNLSCGEGWADKNPTFILADGTLSSIHAEFDLIWAHSVFTHLPPEIVETILVNISRNIHFGKFFFTYKRRERPMRTGLKQFGYDPDWFIRAAAKAGLKAQEMPDKFPQGQSTMNVWQPTMRVER